MTSVCEKCKQEFEWEEEDALCKYKYGTKYLVPCPRCGKLTKVFVNN